MPGMYSKLTERVSYKLLTVLPIILGLMMGIVVAYNGLPLSIDFQGGTWMDILTEQDLGGGQSQQLAQELTASGLKDVKVYVGWDVESNLNKVTVVTTSVIDEVAITPIIEKYTGKISYSDTATVLLDEKPPVELQDKLISRFKQHVSVDYQNNTLLINAIELNQEDLDSALDYYLSRDVNVVFEEKNANVRSVGPTLGATFRAQGIKAFLLAFVFMSIVVFIQFRDFVPSVAVIQAAIFDIVITLGVMSMLGMQLEPASFGALIMLIGYSVDTDIVLTTRVLKHRKEEVNEQIDDAMKTGVMMTGTTLIVMTVVLIVSKTMTQVATLSSISAVIIIGSAADLCTTWLTNAGLLKWYLESSKRRFKPK